MSIFVMTFVFCEHDKKNSQRPARPRGPDFQLFAPGKQFCTTDLG